jgi:hypothetical protein
MQFEDIRMILCRPAGAFRVLLVDRGPRASRLPPATLFPPLRVSASQISLPSFETETN